MQRAEGIQKKCDDRAGHVLLVLPNARKRLLDHTGIKEQEFKIHQVMVYKRWFLVMLLSRRLFQMIHWLKPYFRLMKLLR